MGTTHKPWELRISDGDLMAKNFAGGVMIIQKNASDAPDPLPPYPLEMGQFWRFLSQQLFFNILLKP